MELLLEREYHSSGTNGILSCEERFLCFTIELPWRGNVRLKSCIPEGLYQLVLRFSERHRYHLQVKDVPDRSLILIHKANNALKELQGCIAPVNELLSPGIGKQSFAAFKSLMERVRSCMDKREQVWLRIKRLSNRYHS
ncbi:DUF5675 family protein [Flavihumibacter solisilvae]|uniref:DUF5675 domain-containing protein n=1 Tax=Flavihumibacter solisilvae TaxID=1349421 RepID=A0A0C1KU52_9BACT|nr:DUF5675 family protein [Flavihumibacter solisilvae]KIC91317.1 hypothetical protein OI18_22375 [Flavihumibacter solisilvae]